MSFIFVSNYHSVPIYVRKFWNHRFNFRTFSLFFCIEFWFANITDFCAKRFRVKIKTRAFKPSPFSSRQALDEPLTCFDSELFVSLPSLTEGSGRHRMKLVQVRLGSEGFLYHSPLARQRLEANSAREKEILSTKTLRKGPWDPSLWSEGFEVRPLCSTFPF